VKRKTRDDQKKKPRVWRRADDTPKARAKRRRDFARWLKERGIRLGSDDETDARYGG
jgi:hypothetical protein